MPVPSEFDLANQLFQAAQARATQHGLQLRPGAASELQGLARTGAQNILAAARAKPPELQDSYVRGAARVGVEAMTTFADQMTSARFSITDYVKSYPDSMGEETFNEAKLVLCPLWPIC